MATSPLARGVCIDPEPGTELVTNDQANLPPVVLAVGPSGAGKTTIGKFARDYLGFLWQEADIWMANGISRLRLQRPWRAFLDHADAAPLADTLRLRSKGSGANGMLLSLPSLVLLTSSHLEAAVAARMTPVVVWGRPNLCLTSFLDRERELLRGVGAPHWHHFNAECLEMYGRAEFDPHRLDTFNADGTRKDVNVLVAELHARTRATL